MLALRLALRELRGGVRGLRIVLACLALGVAVIAGVGSLRVAIERGLDADGSRILGGDLEVDGGAQPLPDTLRDWLRAHGARLSDVVKMRSMLIAPSGERQLIELKAVDAAWPLVGTADPPAASLGEHRGKYGIAAEPVVLDRLRLHPGDPVRLGNATLTVRAPLRAEPDRVAGPSMLGARAVILARALPETGLIAPGSMVRYALRVALPAGASPAAVMAELRAAFPDQGWRIRDARHAAPGVSRFVEQTGLFLSLVGLTSLLVGGIGVATGVRAWLEARGRSIATLRCLGASGALVFWVCLLQILALTALGIAAGLIAGAILPSVLALVFAGALPVPPRLGLFPVPLLEAAAFGLLTALSFSLWPLGRAPHISGAALFRDALLPARARPGPWIIAANLVLALALIGLTIATAQDRRFALWFCAAAAGSLVLFRLGGAAVMRAARAAPRLRAPWARLGLANLYRPGSSTPLMLVSVGLGLSTLAAVALIQGNVRQQVLDQVPANAPSFFFVDIQNDQLPRFEALVGAQPGVSETHQMPSMRARIVSVDGVPADQVKATPDTRWALRGDRGLTYSAAPPEGTRIVAGHWWPADYQGPPLLSFDAGLAKGWGIGVGDTIRVNVLGRDIDLKIANLRDIAWRSLGLNFAMVASPGLLANAPHTHIATVRVAEQDQGALLRVVTDALPNVTGIRVEEILHAVADLLDKIATALAATGSITLLAGALVLAGAVASGQRRRTQEAVVLKTLGATRRQIRAAWLVEFGVLGLAAGIIAAFIGTAASYGVVRFLMDSEWAFLPGRLAATIGVCVALMLLFGYAGTASALRAKAAPLLRNQ
jgi:putative ABC transport system permease protein